MSHKIKQNTCALLLKMKRIKMILIKLHNLNSIKTKVTQSS